MKQIQPVITEKKEFAINQYYYHFLEVSDYQNLDVKLTTNDFFLKYAYEYV